MKKKKFKRLEFLMSLGVQMMGQAERRAKNGD
jgi:hypothetical protein